VALLQHDLYRRLPHLQGVRGRRPGALQAAADRAADPGGHPGADLTPAERYVELALGLGEHVEELVFAAPGASPQSIPREAIVEGLEQLELDGIEDEQRRRWLEAQVRALLVIAREEQLPFEEEVEACFGVSPRPIDEANLRAAHAALDDALPGSGPLAERYHGWIRETSISGERLIAALEATADRMRSRTRELVGLPEREGIEIEVVTGVRWVGFSRYLGNRRSRFSYNADLPLPAVDVPHLVAHESYPGHHTEDVWKDVVLVGEEGRVEFTLMLAVGVQPVVAEGIAQLGAELVADAEAHELVASLVPGYDAELGLQVARARRALSDYSTNLTVMHARGASRGELRDWLLEWSLQPPERVEKSLRSLDTRPFRGSPFCYSEGYRLCRAFAGDDPARFRRLLTEQLTPADLTGTS
jgi:hypothetical protein